jgi:hypothetical protein
LRPHVRPPPDSPPSARHPLGPARSSRLAEHWSPPSRSLRPRTRSRGCRLGGRCSASDAARRFWAPRTPSIVKFVTRRSAENVRIARSPKGSRASVRFAPSSTKFPRRTRRATRPRLGGFEPGRPSAPAWCLRDRAWPASVEIGPGRPEFGGVEARRLARSGLPATRPPPGRGSVSSVPPVVPSRLGRQEMGHAPVRGRAESRGKGWRGRSNPLRAGLGPSPP